MKKLCSVIPLFLLVMNVYCQQETSVKFGIKAGVAFATLKQDYIDSSFSSNSVVKPGLIFGGFANIAISKSIFFQPSILYVSKRYDYYNRNHYLEIPLNILYKAQTKRGIFLSGGGVSPAFILNNYYGNQIKQFDLGIGVLVGYQLPIGFSINLGYTYGLLNLSSNKSYISKIQNKYFSLTAGYEF